MSGAKNPGRQLRTHHRPAAKLTARGGVLVMFALSLSGLFAAGAAHRGALAGICYVAACAVAASAVRRADLLQVTVTPPVLFAFALVCVQAVTAHRLLAVAEGTLITLGSVAPWLFAGSALGTAIALARGLTENVRALHRRLHADSPRGGGRDR